MSGWLHKGCLGLCYINRILINISVVFVWQTTGAELLMKCVNIPETNDSVVSPAIVSFSYCVHHPVYIFLGFFYLIKVIKSQKVGGENWNPSLSVEGVFPDINTVSFSSVFRGNRAAL